MIRPLKPGPVDPAPLSLGRVILVAVGGLGLVAGALLRDGAVAGVGALMLLAAIGRRQGEFEWTSSTWL